MIRCLGCFNNAEESDFFVFLSFFFFFLFFFFLRLRGEKEFSRS